MIYYDLHIHSALSPCGDADMTPNNIVNMAALNGLDLIAVTDHNTAGNVRAVMAVGEKVGVRVLPGMEIETAEEVHILTLYPTAEAAEEAAAEVYRHLPDIKNRSEIFGEQLFMDENDDICGCEERLLISPADMSIEETFYMVRALGGLFVPAHIDRHSYSVLTNLGFIPDNIDIKMVEISKRVTDTQAYLSSRSELAGYGILRNSDAHYLEDIAQRKVFLTDIGELFSQKKGSMW